MKRGVLMTNFFLEEISGKEGSIIGIGEEEKNPSKTDIFIYLTGICQCQFKVEACR